MALPAALPARPGSGIRGAGTAVIPGSARRQLILTPVLPTARASTSWQCCGSAELVGMAGVSCPLPISAVPSLLPLPAQQPCREGLAAAQPRPHHQCCSPSRGPGCGIVPAPGSFHHLFPSAAQPVCCFGSVFPLTAPSLSPARPSLGLGCRGLVWAGREPCPGGGPGLLSAGWCWGGTVRGEQELELVPPSFLPGLERRVEPGYLGCTPSCSPYAAVGA